MSESMSVRRADDAILIGARCVIWCDALDLGGGGIEFRRSFAST
jgi:hypothetical protein